MSAPQDLHELPTPAGGLFLPGGDPDVVVAAEAHAAEAHGSEAHSGGAAARPRPTLEELKERKARTRGRLERNVEVMTISMGPQHPSMHGVYRAELDLDGEVVMAVRPEIGNLHRGVEKLCEQRTYHQIVPLTTSARSR